MVFKTFSGPLAQSLLSCFCNYQTPSPLILCGRLDRASPRKQLSKFFNILISNSFFFSAHAQKSCTDTLFKPQQRLLVPCWNQARVPLTRFSTSKFQTRFSSQKRAKTVSCVQTNLSVLFAQRFERKSGKCNGKMLKFDFKSKVFEKWFLQKVFRKQVCG